MRPAPEIGAVTSPAAVRAAFLDRFFRFLVGLRVAT